MPLWLSTVVCACLMAIVGYASWTGFTHGVMWMGWFYGAYVPFLAFVWWLEYRRWVRTQLRDGEAA